LKTIQQMAAAAITSSAEMMAMLQNLLEKSEDAEERAGRAAEQGAERRDQENGRHDGQRARVMDKTMRQQNGNGDPKDGGAQGLAGQAGQLRKDLEGAMKGLTPRWAKSWGRRARR